MPYPCFRHVEMHLCVHTSDVINCAAGRKYWGAHHPHDLTARTAWRSLCRAGADQSSVARAVTYPLIRLRVQIAENCLHRLDRKKKTRRTCKWLHVPFMFFHPERLKNRKQPTLAPGPSQERWTLLRRQFNSGKRHLVKLIHHNAGSSATPTPFAISSAHTEIHNVFLPFGKCPHEKP